jgi:hypothetical protein
LKRQSQRFDAIAPASVFGPEKKIVFDLPFTHGDERLAGLGKTKPPPVAAAFSQEAKPLRPKVARLTGFEKTKPDHCGPRRLQGLEKTKPPPGEGVRFVGRRSSRRSGARPGLNKQIIYDWRPVHP